MFNRLEHSSLVSRRKNTMESETEVRDKFSKLDQRYKNAILRGGDLLIDEIEKYDEELATTLDLSTPYTDSKRTGVTLQALEELYNEDIRRGSNEQNAQIWDIRKLKEHNLSAVKEILNP